MYGTTIEILLWLLLLLDVVVVVLGLGDAMSVIPVDLESVYGSCGILTPE